MPFSRNRVVFVTCLMLLSVLAAPLRAHPHHSGAVPQNPNATDSPTLMSSPIASAQAAGGFADRTLTVDNLYPDRVSIAHTLGTHVITSSGSSFKGPAFNVTITGSQIVVSNPSPSPREYAKGSFNGYKITTDVGAPAIRGVTIHVSNNGFDSSRIAFDPSDIYLDFEGLTSPSGVDVVIDVQFAPEPIAPVDSGHAPQIPNEPAADLSALFPRPAPPPNKLTAQIIPQAGLSSYGMPKCVYCPDAQYSNEAVKANYSGIVMLSAIVGTDGRASNVLVTRSVGLGLDENAIAAVKSWRFKPAVGPDNKPATVRVTIEVTFRMAPGPKEIAAYQDYMGAKGAKKIQAGLDFITHYAMDTNAGAVAEEVISLAYQSQDWPAFYAASDQAHALNPMDPGVLAFAAWVIARNYKDDQTAPPLDQAENEAKRALAILPGWLKPASASDRQFAQMKVTIASQAHSALGLVYARQGKPLDVAAQLEQVTQPDATDIFMLGAAYEQMGKHASAAAQFRKCSPMSGSLQARCTQYAADTDKEGPDSP